MRNGSATLARLKTMTPTSLLRLTLVLLGGVVLFSLAGCRKAPSFFARDNSRPTARPSTTVPAPVNLGNEAIATVTDYLEALQKHDYAAAYSLLSPDAQSKHTRARFEQQGQQGMPSYDLSTARATIKGDTALVAVQQLEDPATHGFTLIRLDGAWKVVYQGGTPGAPWGEKGMANDESYSY